FRSHEPLGCLRLLPLSRRPTSCAKLSERARLVTVAPTLSPMPNGRPLSGANDAAEFASSAIAFWGIDFSRSNDGCSRCTVLAQLLLRAKSPMDAALRWHSRWGCA